MRVELYSLTPHILYEWIQVHITYSILFQMNESTTQVNHDNGKRIESDENSHYTTNNGNNEWKQSCNLQSLFIYTEKLSPKFT